MICSTDKVGVQAEDGSDEYGGSKPFSEPESRIVRLLAENTRPQVSPQSSHAFQDAVQACTVRPMYDGTRS